VLGMENVGPTPEQLKVMKGYVEDAMRDGCIYTAHMRSEGFPITADMYNYVSGATGLDASVSIR